MKIKKRGVINHEGWKQKDYQPWRLKKRFINHEGWKQKIINHQGRKQKDYQPQRLGKDSSIMKIGNKRPSTIMVRNKRFINHEGWKQNIINHEGWKKIHQPWRLGTKGLSTMTVGKRFINHEGRKQRDYQLWRSKKDSSTMKVRNKDIINCGCGKKDTKQTGL